MKDWEAILRLKYQIETIAAQLPTTPTTMKIEGGGNEND